MQAVDVTEKSQENIQITAERLCPQLLGKSDLIATAYEVSSFDIDTPDNYLRGRFEQLYSDLNHINNIITKRIVVPTENELINSKLKSIQVYYSILIIFCFILLFGVLMAGSIGEDLKWAKIFAFVQTWLVYPSFIVMVLVSWALTCRISISAVMNGGAYAHTIYSFS